MYMYTLLSHGNYESHVKVLNIVEKIVSYFILLINKIKLTYMRPTLGNTLEIVIYKSKFHFKLM